MTVATLHTKAPDYIQKGLHSTGSLKDMLECQLQVVWPLEYPTVQRIVERLHQAKMAEPGAKVQVLDVGCGQGAWSRKVTQTFRNCEVLGVDLEEHNIQAARQAQARLTHSEQERLAFAPANAYFLIPDLIGATKREEPPLFDVIACRSMLYTMPNVELVVTNIIRSLQPHGGTAHFLCEDYGSVLAHPTKLDSARFWKEGPCAAFVKQKSNPYMGRAIYHVASQVVKDLGLKANITIQHLPICTTPPLSARTVAASQHKEHPSSVELAADEAGTREGMARVFETWKVYASYVAEHTDFSEEEAAAHFDDHVAACRNPAGYVLWLCTVCQVELVE